MKKRLLAFLTLCLLVPFAACSASETHQTSDVPSAESAQNPALQEDSDTESTDSVSEQAQPETSSEEGSGQPDAESSPSKYILGRTIKDAEAVIFPDNIASQKAFEKAGFIFYSEHPDGDAWNYRYHDYTCYCGHDCARCITYIATQQNDDNLRRQSQSFYKKKFGLDVPLEKFNCNGGRSEKVFEPCKECPFIQCCKQHDIDSCSKCPEYPCKEISNYQAKYVNKCNQIQKKDVYEI